MTLYSFKNQGHGMPCMCPVNLSTEQHVENFYTVFQIDLNLGMLTCPFLCLLLINDIADGISNNIRLFADDTIQFAIVDNDIITPSMSLAEDLGKKMVQILGC